MIVRNLAYCKNKQYKALDYWSREMLNFDFLGKGQRIVLASYFVHDYSRKMFLMLYSINWSNFIVWLPLLLEIMDSICVALVVFPVCDVINFKINLIFLIEPIFYMTENPRQKSKFLENKNNFQGEIESIFHLFKRAFSCQKLSKT